MSEIKPEVESKTYTCEYCGDTVPKEDIHTESTASRGHWRCIRCGSKIDDYTYWTETGCKTANGKYTHSNRMIKKMGANQGWKIIKRSDGVLELWFQRLEHVTSPADLLRIQNALRP